jgi:hypothetical protein
VEVSIVRSDAKSDVENLAHRREEARVDDEESTSGTQNPTDLRESISRSKEVMENPRQRDGVERVTAPRQGILRIRGP